MQKLVLDTNILVGSLLTEGISFLVVEKIFEKKITIIYSSAVLEEYTEVLSNKKFEKKFSQADAMKLIAIIQEIGLLSEPKESIVIFKHEADRKFYDLAKDNGAILITRNLKHFPREKWILSPQDAISVI